MEKFFMLFSPFEFCIFVERTEARSGARQASVQGASLPASDGAARLLNSMLPMASARRSACGSTVGRGRKEIRYGDGLAQDSHLLPY
jgi:hypothetical protein